MSEPREIARFGLGIRIPGGLNKVIQRKGKSQPNAKHCNGVDAYEDAYDKKRSRKFLTVNGLHQNGEDTSCPDS